MQEITHTAISVFRGIQRFRWTALGIAFTLALISAAAVSQLPDKYEATARVFVDSNRVLAPLLKGLTVQPDVDQRVRLMSRTLLNRPNVERLVRMADIGLHAPTDYEKELQLNELQKNIRLRGERGNASLYFVSYTHSDPDIARRVVQSLLTVFIEGTLGDKRQDSESAQEFLDQQIQSYERRLSVAESRLSQFQRDNVGKMPSEAGGYYQRLSLSVDQLRNATLQLQEVENRVLSLKQRLAGEPRTISSGLAGESYSPLDARLTKLQQELSELQLRYTDRHPRIAQLRSSILEVEDLKSKAGSFTQESSISNPVYQEIVKLLAEAEAESAGLQIRVESFQRVVDELNDTVESIPQVEQQLAQLNRDYDVLNEQYQQLLTRRESARLSEDVEQNVDDVKFRIVDPPFVPSRPSSPNKPILTLASFFASIGGGLAFAWLISMLRPVFYDAATIAVKTGRPVLGSVHFQSDRSSAQIASTVLYLMICVFLFLVALLILGIQFEWISPLQLQDLTESTFGGQVQSVIERFQKMVGEIVAMFLGGGV